MFQSLIVNLAPNSSYYIITLSGVIKYCLDCNIDDTIAFKVNIILIVSSYLTLFFRSHIYITNLIRDINIISQVVEY